MSRQRARAASIAGAGVRLLPGGGGAPLFSGGRRASTAVPGASRTGAGAGAGRAADRCGAGEPSQTPSTPPPPPPQGDEISAEDRDSQDFLLTYTVLQRFPRMSARRRHHFLLALLKQCDPGDMAMLYRTLPTLHRDFFVLLPRDLAHRVILHVPAGDLCTAAAVSRSWARIVREPELWARLYADLGLQAMCDVYYSPAQRLAANARRLHSVRNWVRGRFRARRTAAHRESVLALAYDGRFAVTASADRTCAVWDVRDGEKKRTLAGSEGAVNCVQFDQTKHVYGWKFLTGCLVIKCPAHSGAVTCLRYNSTILVTGSSDKTIKIW
ncbi:MAG: WD40-repeat-containing domain protein, partial [Olpidium bornovanus]